METSTGLLNNMVDFNEFMSVYLSKCGSSRADFAAGVKVWNNEKEDIRSMSRSEVEEELVCA